MIKIAIPMDNKTSKLNRKSLASIIKEVFAEIETTKKTVSENIEKTVETTEVKMNANDKLGDSKKALVYKNTEKKEEKAGEAVVDVKMNQMGKDLGSDEKAHTAVSVEAGAAKKEKGPTTGLANAKFETKTENPSVGVSDPFKEKAVDKMNTMDKLTDEETKTYVEAGAAESGHAVTAGLHKAKVHEKAPVTKDKEPIAKGIEIKESYTKSELIKFIKEEAVKLAKKQLIEEELAKLKNQLSTL